MTIGIVSQLLSDNAAIFWVPKDRKKFLYLPERPDEVMALSLKDHVEFEVEDGHAVNVRVISEAPTPSTESRSGDSAIAH